MPKQQPTILVKKADGTKVRVSLAEFRKLRNKEQGIRNSEIQTTATSKTKIEDKLKISSHGKEVLLDEYKKEERVMGNEERKNEPVVTGRDLSSSDEVKQTSQKIILKPAIVKEDNKPVGTGLDLSVDQQTRLQKSDVRSMKSEVEQPKDRSALDKLIASEEARTQIGIKEQGTRNKEYTEKSVGIGLDLSTDKQVLSKPVEDDIQIAPPHELATTTPVTDIFIDEAQAEAEWDHTSLLEENMSEIEDLKQKGAVHTTHEDVTQKVKLPKSAQKKDDNVSTRLKSLIASWQKGIRSDAQFIDMATREVVQGGVGMDKVSAEGLLSELQKSKTAGAGYATNEPIQKKRVTMDDIHAQTHVPRVPSSPVMKTDRIMPPRPTQPREHTTPQKVVRDVQAPIQPDMNRQTVGPQQEVGTFTLVDFRRLSREPEKAGEMLVAKFMNWKDEYFLLYMDARETWRKSPLYQQYIILTQEAMDTGKTVADIISEKNPEEFMTFEEYTSIISVDNQLTI